MQIDILTIFPEMFKDVLEETILKRAQEKGLVEINAHNLRDWTTDKHKTTDNRPFGGGAGMVMKVEPIYRAIQDLRFKNQELSKTVLLTPQGKVFKQSIAEELAKLEQVILICGRYEGVDERVRELVVDEEISIGDYVLSGGEIPAMVVIDTLVRLMPGVLGNEESLQSESFKEGSLDYPQYTQPREFQGLKVPEILLSGHHEEIAKWRKEQALQKTKEKRPELIKDGKKGR